MNERPLASHPVYSSQYFAPAAISRGLARAKNGDYSGNKTISSSGCEPYGNWWSCGENCAIYICVMWQFLAKLRKSINQRINGFLLTARQTGSAGFNSSSLKNAFSDVPGNTLFISLLGVSPSCAVVTPMP